MVRSGGLRFRVGPYYRNELPIEVSKVGVGRCEFTVVGPLCVVSVAPKS